ncbi:glutamate--cysteine ligase [Sinomonas sp. ASV322]|uniref:glutamate--cysteine ligase n=1 Tax=Sinomonas sp. ASV322 TaxID=3041920 RepID=UPI0027DDFA8C|nr:glutamate--cysteine ligase [Sinomonas sp. ASV322]MDQ4502517.1 glutamate--cysteine ligase [Sinomonas sp. ASV322]
MRTFGVEEELLIVDPATGQPAALADRMLAVTGRPPDMVREFKLEQIEVQTPPCRDHDELLECLYAGRQLADRAARRCGGRVVALATSPMSSPTTLSPGDRYARMAEEFRLTSREQLTCGLHVHVGVASPDEGVAVLDRIREWLPLVVALSANSPFWFGDATGYASYRTQAWNRWPSSGPQELYGRAAAYRERIAAMIATGSIFDEAMAYFDARLSRNHPTVEVRVPDVPLVAGDSALFAVLVRALVETTAREAADGVAPLGTPVAVLRLAAWRASRSGLDGDLVHPVEGIPVPAGVAVEALMAYIGPVLRDGGEYARTELAVAELLARGSGERAQRQAAGKGGLAAVVEMALSRTASPTGSWNDGARATLSIVRRR